MGDRSLRNALALIVVVMTAWVALIAKLVETKVSLQEPPAAAEGE